MKQFGRSLRAVWHGTIWQWWFLLAGFSRVVAEGASFVVSIMLMYTLGDAYAGMALFTPELTLWYLGTAGNDPLQWFNARALQVVTAYALGWLLVGLLPAWRKRRPRHALVMLETACVFVAANLTALALWIFVFKYDSHTITSTNWVLVVFQSFTLPAYCIVGVIVAMAGARATWRTASRALAVGLSLFFINLACERSSGWVLARLFSNMDFAPLWAGLLPLVLMIGVFTVAALFVYAAVADGENLWTAFRKGFSFVVRHAWVALVMGTVLLISNPSVIYVIEKILWWLGRSYPSGFDGNSKFSLMDVHTFLVLVALAVASQYYTDVKRQRVAEQVSSAESVPAHGKGLLAVKWQLMMATPLLVLALVTVSLAPALSSPRTSDSLFGAATTTTITLAGSSAHWDAKYIVLMRTPLKNGETRCSANLDVSWTGPSSETITQVRYKLSDQGELKPGTLSAESGGLGAESGRWVLHNEGLIVGRYSGPGATQELLLTITWKGQTETMSLGITQNQTD
jgi:hypothetical protein